MSKIKLGRGLAALLPDVENKILEGSDNNQQVKEIPTKLIKTNPYQPRIIFKEDNIAELASSIKENGLIQPIVVRERENGAYELIAGERRLRAVVSLKKDNIKAIVLKEISDKESMIMSLVENIQREDINALEKAEAYQKIMQAKELTQEELALSIGKSRSAVANTLRLLNLSLKCKEALLDGKISEGHARQILKSANQNEQEVMLNRILKDGLNVRESEKNFEPKAITDKARVGIIKNKNLEISYRYSNGHGRFLVKFGSEEQFKKLEEYFKTLDF